MLRLLVSSSDRGVTVFPFVPSYQVLHPYFCPFARPLSTRQRLFKESLVARTPIAEEYTLAAVIGQTICDRGDEMKYVISWNERPQGSPAEYENAQKRILEVFGQWKAPANFKIEVFVVRVGEWGGHMLVDCDDPLTVHKFCSMLPAFEFQARPVVAVEEAVRAELEVMAWRDGLKGK
jgi:hypothetical protein